MTETLTQPCCYCGEPIAFEHSERGSRLAPGTCLLADSIAHEACLDRDWASYIESKRAEVVAAARAWVGTPYHHMADVKGVGVDCGMLLVRVYCDLGLVEAFDPRPYTRDWHAHRDEERYLGFLLARTHEVSAPLPGDIVLFKYGRCYSHGGIVTRADPLTIIHAFAPARIVLEEEIGRNAQIAARLPRAKFASYWSTAP